MGKTHVIDGKTYAEVERKAEVGEKVIIVEADDANNDGYVDGAVFEIDKRDSDYDDICYTDENITLYDSEYHVLEPVADAKPSYELNDLLSQITPEKMHEEWPPYTEEHVAVTANDIRWHPDKVIDLLANLARRVSSLERQVESLSTQLADTQGNVERQGVEIAELEKLTESNEEDIRTLDERTQPKPHVVDAFPSNAKLLADAFAALAKYGNGGGRE